MREEGEFVRKSLFPFPHLCGIMAHSPHPLTRKRGRLLPKIAVYLHLSFTNRQKEIGKKELDKS